MTDDLFLRRKWTLRAGGRQIVVVKKSYESTEHVVMKALIWALYLPTYGDLTVEVAIGDKYKPDVVSLDERGEPQFWGEAGDVSTAKIKSLARRYKRTHFALGKWDTRLGPLIEIVRRALAEVPGRTAPFDLISFPSDSIDRFISDDGVITVEQAALEWVRL